MYRVKCVSGTRIYVYILLSKSISDWRFYDYAYGYMYSGTRLYNFVFGLLYLILTFLVQALFVSPYHCQQSQQNILSNLKGIPSPTHLLILTKNH